LAAGNRRGCAPFADDGDRISGVPSGIFLYYGSMSSMRYWVIPANIKDQFFLCCPDNIRSFKKPF
jgi:hypothetical protein